MHRHGGCYTRVVKVAKIAEAEPSDIPASNVLARSIRRFAQTDGDHNTVIPALTLHRRSAPSEPLHCIYNLGLGVVAQGGKQVLLGSEGTNRQRHGAARYDVRARHHARSIP